MEETSEEKVVVNTEKRDCVYDEYSCSNILFCKYPLHEVIRAIFFKCFGFETRNEPAAACRSQSPCSCSTSDVKEMDPPPCSSTTEPVPLLCPSMPGPTETSEDMAMRFRPPPRPQPTRGRGPQTNSSGNS